ncbi:MAG: AraC family transcriptional regulator [Myxococcota bacterium]
MPYASMSAQIVRPIPHDVCELLTIESSRGQTDHGSGISTILRLRSGRLGLGPPKHFVEMQAGQSVVIAGNLYVARLVLTEQAQWQEIQLAAPLEAGAPFFIDEELAERCADAVERGETPPCVVSPAGESGWPNTRKLQRAREVLGSSTGLRIQVGELSEQTRTHPHELTRMFRRELGTTPHQYQIVARLSRARRYLRQGLEPAMAAMRAGFYDQSHLGRHMKRKLGLTPATYARGGPGSSPS